MTIAIKHITYEFDLKVFRQNPCTGNFIQELTMIEDDEVIYRRIALGFFLFNVKGLE